MCVAGVITLIICYFTSKYLHAHELIRIAVIGILCLTIYTGLNLAMKMEYAGELAKRLTERFKR